MRHTLRGADKLDVCHLQITQMLLGFGSVSHIQKVDTCTEVSSHSDGVHHKLKLRQMATIGAAHVYYMCMWYCSLRNNK